MPDWDEKDKKRENTIDELLETGKKMMSFGDKLQNPEPLVHVSMSLTFKQLREVAEALTK